MDTVKYWLADIWSFCISFACWFVGPRQFLTAETCDYLDHYFSFFAHTLAVVIGVLTLIFITIPKTYNQYKRLRHGKK